MPVSHTRINAHFNCNKAHILPFFIHLIPINPQHTTSYENKLCTWNGSLDLFILTVHLSLTFVAVWHLFFCRCLEQFLSEQVLLTELSYYSSFCLVIGTSFLSKALNHTSARLSYRLNPPVRLKVWHGCSDTMVEKCSALTWRIVRDFL